MKIPHTEQELREKILRTLRIRPDDLLRYEIVRQSLDARGDELKYVYIIDAEVKKEAAILRKHPKQVGKAQHIRYQFPKSGTERLAHRPVIIGTGPGDCSAALRLPAPDTRRSSSNGDRTRNSAPGRWRHSGNWGCWILSQMSSLEKGAPVLFLTEN